MLRKVLRQSLLRNSIGWRAICGRAPLTAVAATVGSNEGSVRLHMIEAESNYEHASIPTSHPLRFFFEPLLDFSTVSLCELHNVWGSTLLRLHCNLSYKPLLVFHCVLSCQSLLVSAAISRANCIMHGDDHDALPTVISLVTLACLHCDFSYEPLLVSSPGARRHVCEV